MCNRLQSVDSFTFYNKPIIHHRQHVSSVTQQHPCPATLYSLPTKNLYLNSEKLLSLVNRPPRGRFFLAMDGLIPRSPWTGEKGVCTVMCLYPEGHGRPRRVFAQGYVLMLPAHGRAGAVSAKGRAYVPKHKDVREGLSTRSHKLLILLEGLSTRQRKLL